MLNQRLGRHTITWAILLVFGVAVQPVPVLGQEKPPATQSTAAPWASQCASAARGATLECSMEQRLVLEGSGQFLARLVIKQHAPGQPPVMMLHVPLGVSLPAGLRLGVDDAANGIQLAYQTCDGSGCYAAEQIAEPVLAGLRAGKQLSLHFEDAAKRPIDLRFSLEGFAASYDSIN